MRDLASLALPDHWAADAFRAHALVELHSNAPALPILQVCAPPARGPPAAPTAAAAAQGLATLLPGSSYVRGRVLRALYSLRQNDRVVDVLASLREADPFRLDDADLHSNML